MIINYGNTSILCGPWYMLELLSENSLEATLRRICEAIPRIFDKSAVRIFAPIDHSERFSLRSGCYIHVQSNDLQSLKRLKTVRGVVDLMKHKSGLIEAGSAEIAGLIEKERNDHENHSKCLQIGSFVRVLDGCFKNYRGSVRKIKNGWCAVEIVTETGIVKLKTLAGNLRITLPESVS